MKKIILFSYLLCCFNLFAFYYDSTGIQSSLDQKPDETSHISGLSEESQKAIEAARKKESDITDLGNELDNLDEKAIELLEEIDSMSKKKNHLKLDDVSPEYIDQYLKALEKDGNKDKNLQIIKDKFYEYEYNRYQADNIRKKIVQNTEEIEKIMEPVINEMKEKNLAGDPVSTTTGAYVYEHKDGAVQREYKYGRTGVFGKNWVSYLDSRIIRCKVDDFEDVIDKYNKLLLVYNESVQKIRKLKETYNDVFQFDEKLYY